MRKKMLWPLLLILVLLGLIAAQCGAAPTPETVTVVETVVVEKEGKTVVETVVVEKEVVKEVEVETEVVVTATADAEAEQASSSGSDTIVWARYGDADTIDPQKASSTLSWQVYDQVYDTLLAFDAGGNIVPHVAKEWSVNEDGTEVTFTLNEGVMCHDGTTFTAEDVKFTAERAINPDTGNPTRSAWGPIANVEVIDELTVKFVFETPFGPFVSFMADPFGSMVCKSGVEKHGDQFGNNPVGTGPWKFISWTKGDQILLERNEEYVNYGRPVKNAGPPTMKYFAIKTIPEGQTRLAAVETDAVHFAEPPLEEVDRLLEDDSFKFHIAANTGQHQFIEFTTARPPFDEKWARQAVAYAVDIPTMLNIVFGELVEWETCAVAAGVLGNDRDWCHDISTGNMYDPEKAKTLLAEHGYDLDNPLEVTFMSYTGGNRDKTLQVLQQQLAEVGIEANIEMMDIGTLNARVKTENNTLEGNGTLDSMGWAWFDPDILYQLWHCPGWVDGYCSPELDVLLEETRSLTDPADRAEKVKEVTEFLYNDFALIPMYTPAWEWIYVSKPANVEGFVYGPFNRPLFNDVIVK